MTTTIATAMATGDAGAAAERLTSEVRAKLGGATPALLAVFASTGQPLDELAARLSAQFPDVALIGASSAGEFTERGDAKGSASMFALAGDYRVFAGIGAGLKASPEGAMQRALEGLPQQLHGFPHRTAILLLDPLSGNAEETVLLAASMLGHDVPLAGGAAGDDLKMARTQVACGAAGARESDAVTVALIFSRSPLGVGVCHGHSPLSRPLKITRAHDNIVEQLEGRPAWQVWVEQTRKRAPRRSA